MIEDAQNAAEGLHRGQFAIADYVIFLLLMLGSLVVGIGSGIRGWSRATTEDFLVGGRQMHPIPVSMSLVGGVVSALSVLGNATEIYFYGTQVWLNIIGCFIGTLIVMYIVIPVLYPLELVSMMQYIEMRFKSKNLRKLASLSQLINIGFYLGLCLYAPALALSSVTDIPSWASVIGLGLICTIYISLGGVKAVVYTDVLQTTIMFLGVAIVVIKVCMDVGGLNEVFRIADEGGRIQFFNFDLNPTTRHTFWSVQVLGIYFVVSNLGITQAQFQRIASVKTLKLSQLLCVLFFGGLFALWSLFYLSGVVAYAAYHDCDPLTNKQIDKPDQIIPFMVADKLSSMPGMAGLFVAAVYGAVLSSVSSQASAFAALVWEDFLSDCKWFNKNSMISPVNVTRVLSAAAGLMGVMLAFIVGRMGTLFQAGYSITGALVGPLTGLFLTAMTAPWVNSQGAIIGFISSFVFNVWLVLGQLINNAGKEPHLPLSIQGCLSINNTDFEQFEDITYSPKLISMNSEHDSKSDHLALYDVSYCFLGTLGVIIVFVVSSLVSFLTGPNHPDDIDPKLVHKKAFELYRNLWHSVNKTKSGTETSVPRHPSQTPAAELKPLSFKLTQ